MKKPIHNLVFLHGIAASRRFVAPLLEEFKNNPLYETFAFDLLGFGKERKRDSNFTLAEHLDFITESITRRFGSEQVTLIGHSMGGILALAWAAKYPEHVQKVILLNVPLGSTEKEVKDGIKKVTRGLTPVLLTHPRLSKASGIFFLKIGLFRLLSYLPLGNYAQILADYTRNSWKSLYQSFIHVILKTPGVPLVEQVSSRIPILSIIASKDSKICQYPLQGENITLIELSGTHFLPLEDPKGVAKEIKKFLER